MAGSANPLVTVSWGEFLDKMTILEIKLDRVTGRDAQANVRRELDMLNALWRSRPELHALASPYKADLREINEALWDIENRIRVKEATQAFDQEFIELARNVYRSNDRRAAIKKDINNLLNSGLHEEKQYSPY